MPVRKILLYKLLIILCSSLSAQEVLLPLQSNPFKFEEIKSGTKNHTNKEETVLELPFFEDFSYAGPYPDQRLWADSFVYINSSFQVHPISIGVATFDALDQFGKIYEHASDNMYQFVADHLTSHKIRLDSVFYPDPNALNPSDSVYLSFYYQPQGSGFAPNDRDSLVLEFLHTPAHYYIEEDEGEDNGNNGDTVWVDDKWVSIWRSEGMSLSEFSNDTFPYFKRVVIPVIDTTYFRDDFRFRFKNYSNFPLQKEPDNYAGNRHIWNVDYITLDSERSMADRFYYDLTFAKPAKSILRRYTAMPWSHYIENPDNHLKNNLEVSIKNLNDIEHNYTYRYFIKNEQGDLIRNYSGGTWNIAPFYQSGYQDYELHANPTVLPDPLPTTPAEKRQFRIIHAIKEGTTGDDNMRNDTIFYDQVFDNYFAYDNGISNAGYILDGYEPQSATRFLLSHPDTLYGVKIFFNHTLEYQNESTFHIMVWSSLDPEEIAYESEVVLPEYSDELNKFYTYCFGDDYVLLQDTFYIGWKQTTNRLLNVGFDLDNSSHGNLFHNSDGEWQPSLLEGALMIRPVVGRKSDETHIIKTEKPEPLAISIYPNPVRGNYLNIKMDDTHSHNTENFVVQIFDMQGRLLFNDQLGQTIPVSDYPNGIYIVRVFDRNSSYSTSEKVIIGR